jgi:TRAP-type C4-dicarboxylate transport system permease small subunit
MITKLNDWVARALLATAATLAFLICFLVCADVIGRVAFNSPLKGTPEIVSFSIVIICFLQAPFAIRSGGMIFVDAVTSRLP